MQGGRIPLYLGSRCLPIFLPGDASPVARGYVESNYIEGLRPGELFCHLMTARDSLSQAGMGPEDAQRRATDAVRSGGRPAASD